MYTVKEMHTLVCTQTYRYSDIHTDTQDIQHTHEQRYTDAWVHIERHTDTHTQ